MTARGWLGAALAVAAALAVVLWVMSAPEPLPAEALPVHEPDLANGEAVFRAAGCASCHAAPGARGDDVLMLAGGLELKSPFGVFRVPNISPHPDDGVGDWSTLDFVNAILRGVSPGGSHYYPSLPYASYARMRLEDAIDLKAYIETLPAVAGRVADHSLPFPFNVRRGLGLWKRLYVDADPIIEVEDESSAVLRGRYLVEGPGHCGECHTPRDRFGGLRADAWLSGAAHPAGEGSIPNITDHPDGLQDWSAADISFYLKAGLTPDLEVVGEEMAAVQREIAKLADEDRDAIAAYLKAVPPRPNGYTPQAPSD